MADQHSWARCRLGHERQSWEWNNTSPRCMCSGSDVLRPDDKDVVSFFKCALNFRLLSEWHRGEIEWCQVKFSYGQWRGQVANWSYQTKLKRDIPQFCWHSELQFNTELINDLAASLASSRQKMLKLLLSH